MAGNAPTSLRVSQVGGLRELRMFALESRQSFSCGIVRAEMRQTLRIHSARLRAFVLVEAAVSRAYEVGALHSTARENEDRPSPTTHVSEAVGLAFLA
jgi:hypothetical protein